MYMFSNLQFIKNTEALFFNQMSLDDWSVFRQQSQSASTLHTTILKLFSFVSIYNSSS